MRRLGVAVAAIVLAGCSAPSADAGDGGLWAREAIRQELSLARLSDPRRAALAREVELSLADELLDREQARLAVLLADCPAAQRQSLVLSEGDRARDAARLRIADDASRRARVADQALADWFIRRGRATGSGE
ncbi:MAG: hypothetical protein M3336_11865, partial [Chloroflexota bacterium]|nr:hypothetical protein [Chloroflexota bacterium]